MTTGKTNNGSKGHDPFSAAAGHRSGSASAISAMENKTFDQLWQEHCKHEFATRDVEATLDTMVDDAYVNHVPVLTGGVGKAALRGFYSRDFIPSMPSDTALTVVSRTVGQDQLVDEMAFSFTHTRQMPSMLPAL